MRTPSEDDQAGGGPARRSRRPSPWGASPPERRGSRHVPLLRARRVTVRGRGDHPSTAAGRCLTARTSAPRRCSNASSSGSSASTRARASSRARATSLLSRRADAAGWCAGPAATQSSRTTTFGARFRDVDGIEYVELLPRRHGRDDRPLADAGRTRRWLEQAARADHADAPERAGALGGGRVDAAIRATEVAVRAHGRRTPTGSRSGWPGSSPDARRCSSSTGATTEPVDESFATLARRPAWSSARATSAHRSRST